MSGRGVGPADGAVEPVVYLVPGSYVPVRVGAAWAVAEVGEDQATSVVLHVGPAASAGYRWVVSPGWYQDMAVFVAGVLNTSAKRPPGMVGTLRRDSGAPGAGRSRPT